MKKLIKKLRCLFDEKKQEKLNKSLVEAVRHNNFDKVKTLLEEGADPNYREFTFSEEPLPPGSYAKRYVDSDREKNRGFVIRRYYYRSLIHYGVSQQIRDILSRYGYNTRNSSTILCKCEGKCTCREELDKYIEGRPSDNRCFDI